MATILTKKKDTTGAPVAGDLTNSAGGAELAVNTADKRLYTKDSGGNVVEVGTNPSTLTVPANQLNSITVGQGAGSVSTNTAVGASALAANTTGANNTSVGYQALDANTTGAGNTAVGSAALGANTTGANNTAVGYGALDANTTGVDNTAMGVDALGANTTNYNNAFGYQAMFNTTTGTRNNAIGRQALYTNTTGNDNVALGHAALRQSTTASGNTAIGYEALYANTTGANNTAVGYAALDANTTGANNVAVGNNALGACTTGQFNTAIGVQALQAITTGTYNTAIGYQAGYSSNVAGVGAGCFIGQATGYSSTGAKNTFVGGDAAGYDMTTGASNTILGNFRGNQDGLDIRTSSNYAVISDGDGNRLLSMYNGGTLALDGGAVPQAGTGITFPATQSASTNANTLDDYEEGEWTGTLKGSISDPTTPVTSTGIYTKVGRLVTVQISYANVNTTGASGSVYITALPFTVVGNAMGSVMSYQFNFNGLTSASAYANGTTIEIFTSGNNANWAGMQHNAGTGRYIFITITYMV